MKSKNSVENENQRIINYILISISVHILFFAAITFFPNISSGKKQIPLTISVDLVSMSLPAPASSASMQESTAVSPVNVKKKKADLVVKKKKPPVIKKQPEKTEPKVIKKTTVKKVIKKPEVKKKKVVKKKPEPKKKKVVPKKKVNPLEEAMKKMKKKVAEETDRESTITNNKKPINKTKKSIEVAGTGTGSGLSGNGTDPSGGKLATLLDVYKSNVGVDIERGWAFPESLAGLSGKLIAEISIEIYPSGELKRAEFSKKSGNRYLDESAMNAVIKAAPFMPHPDGIIKPYVPLTIRFSPPEN